MTPEPKPTCCNLPRRRGVRTLFYAALGVIFLIAYDWFPFPLLRLIAGLVAPVWLATWSCGTGCGVFLAVALPLTVEHLDGGWFHPPAALANLGFTATCILCLSVLALFLGRARPPMLLLAGRPSDPNS